MAQANVIEISDRRLLHTPAVVRQLMAAKTEVMEASRDHARTFFEQIEQARDNAEARARALQEAVWLAGYGFSQRQVAALAQMKSPTGAQRYMTVAKAVVKEVAAPEGLAWEAAFKTMTLRDLVDHVQAANGKPTKAPSKVSPMDRAKAQFRRLIAAIAKANETWNANEAIKKYLTGTKNPPITLKK